MANACKNIALLLGLVGTAGILYVLSSKHWKQNSQVSSQNILQGIQSFQGLWVRCTSPEPGTFLCDEYDVSYLGLPPILQGLRAMMCIASAAALFGLIAGLAGMDWVSVLVGSPGKVWTGRIGGGLLILGGLLCLASVSWYAVDVINSFHYTTTQPQNQSFVYELGIALWIGWVAGGITLISGILFLCCNCSNSSDSYGSSKYSGAPSYGRKVNQNRPADYV